ncbi:MAG: PAS domain S-box protein [Chloroflexi bacterium]|nr:PAS domain S-box protein [Chloroflexota bacterium]
MTSSRRGSLRRGESIDSGGTIYRSDRLSLTVEEQAAVLSAIFTGSADGMAFIDLDFVIRAANQSLARQIVVPLDKIVGHCGEEVVPGSMEQVEHIYRDIRETGRPFRAEEYPFVFKDQPERGVTYWDSTVSPIYGADGTLLGYLLLLREVTERKRTEEERERLLAQGGGERQNPEELARTLEKERDTLQAIMESTHTQLAYLDAQLNFVRVNSAYAQGSGYSKEALIGRNHFELFPNPENQAIFERVRETGQPVEFQAKPFEFAYLPWRGVTYWDLSLVPVKDRAGRVEGLVLSLLDVTDWVRAEEALRREKEYSEKLVETANVMIVGLDSAGNISLFNQEAEEITGYARDELKGKNWFEVLVPKDRYPLVWKMFTAAMAGAVLPETFENPILTKSGEERYISWRNSEVREQDKVIGTISFGIDISDRKRMEEDLRRARDELEIRVKERTTELAEANEELHTEIAQRELAEEELQARERQQAAVAELGQQALAGLDTSTLMDKAVVLLAQRLQVEYAKVLELLPDGKALLLRAGVGWKEGYVRQATVGAGTDSQAGYTLLSDKPVIVEDLRTETRFSGPPLLREHGVVSGMSVIIAGRDRPFGVLGAHTTRRRTFTQDDISFLQAIANVLAMAIQRKDDDEALRRSEARYRIVADNAYSWEFWISPQRQFLYCSPSCERITGYGAREFEADPDFLSRIVHPDDAPRWVAHRQEVERGITPGELEFRIISRDGRETWISHQCQPVYDADGQFLGTRGSNRDITERKRAEAERERLLTEVEQLAETAQQRASELEAVVESIADEVFVCDKEGRIVDLNQSALKLIGLTRKEEALRPMVDYLHLLKLRHPDGRPVNAEELASSRALRGEIVRDYEEIARELPTQRDVYLLVSAAPIRDLEGNIVGAVQVLSDITRIKELDRLKDQFISVAAHELKTPVAVMKGYAQALLRRVEEFPPQCRKMLGAINRGADRLDMIVKDLLDISRLHLGYLELAKERIELPKLVEEVVDRMALTTAKHRIRVVKAEPVLVQGDRGRLEQVLINLIDNAIKYSPKGGDIDLEVAVLDHDAVVSIKDYGVGIPKEKQGRIFERFYRAHIGTPYDYGGMGVGLSISLEIVSRHGGRMWFESEEGRGSTFYFSLPLRSEGT